MMTLAQGRAWLVHLYTALGGVLGVFALSFAARGDVRACYALLVGQMLIDATDGMLARRWRIKEVLPHFDGATLDNVIDMLTYIWIPLFIMVDQALLPHPLWVVFPAFAAMYAYGQTNMKTDDGYFVGFPSYWNIVALYLYWLRPTEWLTLLLVLVPSVLSFVPTRYLYPSKGMTLWKTAWGLGALWFVWVLWLLAQETPTPSAVIASLFFPLWYLGASFYVEWRERAKAQRGVA
jgi:phosphatidylcholine synthase